MDSFLFHDYETFGADPMRDGVAQFAAIRTNLELEPIDEPVSVFCRPVVDRLPQPQASLITGITPQHAQAQGVAEAEFAEIVRELMSVPGTCSLGYNSIRFDDAVTRHLLWRNLHDPYSREWRNGNSRFDLIDLARLCHALRPEGIRWPQRDDGRASFKLEHLTKANDLDQARAHDALSDVHATIGLARLIRSRQPRLWQWALGMRDKRRVRGLLDWAGGTPLVHSSEKFPAERGCTSVVLPVAPDPTSEQGVIVVDLMADPAPLLALEADELRDRLYTPRADLPEGIERPALKCVYVNRCPMLAPLSVLAGVDLERIGLDPDRCERHRQQLLAAPGLRQKLAEVMTREGGRPEPEDVELSLYSGGFPSPAERARLDQARTRSPAELAAGQPQFEQARHAELLFRRRARNWPENLTSEENSRWRAFVAARLRGEHPLSQTRDGPYGLVQYREEISRLRQLHAPGPNHALLDQLEAWGWQLEQDWL
ncbi:MAG: exodeoxyribonuclease I [Xanthomonadales bacterium]|nr:exodeoxyribonuclease I [Xanthomonadales bacterium]